MPYIIKVRPTAGSRYTTPKQMARIETYFKDIQSDEGGQFVLLDNGAEDEAQANDPPKRYPDGTYQVFVYQDNSLRLVRDVLAKVFGLEIVSQRKEGERR